MRAKYRVPIELTTTMKEEYVERAFKKYCEAVCQDSLALIADGIWCVIEEAHNEWREQEEIKRILHHSEECANWLNAGVRLELTGGAIWGVWAARFQKCFRSLNLPLNQTLDVAGFNSQMNWMEGISFSQPPLMNNIFLINRRRFVEDAMLSGKGSLFRYMLDQCTGEDQNFLYRQTRQIILANGGGAPIDW